MIARKFVLGSLVPLALCGQATAAEFQIEEIIVTAQKRNQSLQDVPIAMTALSGNDIAERNIFDPLTLAQQTPSLVGGMTAGVPSYYIRGVGTSDFGAGADPAVGIYLDGVYISRNSGSLISLLDVERVEIVKGPQGTLFGRNAAAGAISVITKKPTFEPDGTATVAYGNYNHIKLNGSLSGALVPDKLAARVSVIFEERDGFVKNHFAGETIGLSDEDNKGVRLALRYTPSPGVTLDLSGDYLARRPNGGGFLPMDNPSFDVVQDLGHAAKSHVDIYGGGLHGEFELNDQLTLTSITAYRGYRWTLLEDDDALDIPLLHTGYGPEKTDMLSQELRLLSVKDKGLTWFIGASASYEKIKQDTIIISDADLLIGPGSGGVYHEFMFGDTKNQSYALYGDVTAYLTEKISVTGGLRWGYDKKNFRLFIPPSPDLGFNILFPEVDPPFEDSRHWSTFQPRFVVQYYPMETLTAYASVTKGYKAGGFNSFSVQPAFNPETIWNFEAGLKGRTSDNRLSLNLTGFYYTYDNLQVTTQVGVNLVTSNAAKASGKGIELEGVARPLADLTLRGAFTYLDAKYDRFLEGELDENFAPIVSDRSGNFLTRAPKFQFNLGAEYTIQNVATGRVTLLGDVNYQSRTYFAPANDRARSQKSYALANFRVTWTSESERYQVSAYVQNLFDQRYVIDAGGVAQDLGAPNVLPGYPRFYGVALTVRPWQ